MHGNSCTALTSDHTPDSAVRQLPRSHFPSPSVPGCLLSCSAWGALSLHTARSALTSLNSSVAQSCLLPKCLKLDQFEFRVREDFFHTQYSTKSWQKWQMSSLLPVKTPSPLITHSTTWWENPKLRAAFCHSVPVIVTMETLVSRYRWLLPRKLGS